MIRVLYLGQKSIGEECFEILRRARTGRLHICGVVSNTDTTVWWRSNGIYRQAVAEKIPFISNARRNNEDINALILKEKIDTVISVQHSWILPKSVLESVNYNAFNLHNAKLPDYKGHNSCNHAILNGERYYTSTVHRMMDRVDTGEIAFEETFRIDAHETAESLYKKALMGGMKAFAKLINCLISGKPVPRIPMIGEGIFYPRNSIDALRLINDPEDAGEVDRKSRAFYFPPFEPAYYMKDGRKFYALPKQA